MINDLLSPLTASSSPFAKPKFQPSDEMLRLLASEIVRLTPTLAETLVKAAAQNPPIDAPENSEQLATDR